MKWLPLVMIVLSLGGCAGRAEQRFEFSQIVMGVAARVELYAPGEREARAGAAGAFARMAELEAVMSDYRPDSELMRLCARAGGPPVAVSRDLFDVLSRAQEISGKTDGAFDVTVGPLVDLWREARRSGVLPSAEAVSEAKRKVGFEHVALDPSVPSVRLAAPGMRLDLGGIGKCYAADEALRRLRDTGHPRCLVAIGGDIVAGDPPPGGAGWKVAVERPDGLEKMMVLARRAVSSSGDTQQFVEIGGRRYSHIVDPATGLGLTSRIGATVSAPDGATADALATAVCVLGRERGLAAARRFPGARVQVYGDNGAGGQ
jgi:thiamine biosynthesis lipoprotein